MENASKALIIAGAILLAIVIISLGLIVVNNVRETTDNTNLTEQEIQSFNAKFIPYEGNNISGSRVNTLIQQVISSNQDTTNKGGSNYVAIGFPTISYKNGKCCVLYVAKKKNDTSKIIPFAFIVKENGEEVNKPSVSQIANKTNTISETNVESPSVALSVDTGKQYTVTLGYKNGLVSAISCLQN